MIWSQWNISLVHSNICTCQTKIWELSGLLLFWYFKCWKQKLQVAAVNTEPKSLTLVSLSSQQPSCCLFRLHRRNTGICSITALWTRAAPPASPHVMNPGGPPLQMGTHSRSWMLGANCTTLHIESNVYQRMSQTAVPAGSYIPEAQW